MQRRVRASVPEQARLEKPPSEKRGSAGATQKIAANTGRASTMGTLDTRIGMGDFMSSVVTNVGSEVDASQKTRSADELQRTKGYDFDSSCETPQLSTVRAFSALIGEATILLGASP